MSTLTSPHKFVNNFNYEYYYGMTYNYNSAASSDAVLLVIVRKLYMQYLLVISHTKYTA